jgi:hypothetical protein
MDLERMQKILGFLWFQLILGNGRLRCFMRLVDVIDYTFMRLELLVQLFMIT